MLFIKYTLTNYYNFLTLCSYCNFEFIFIGEISSKNLTVTGSLNEFFYQQCTWVLDSNVERQLFIDISSEQVFNSLCK